MQGEARGWRRKRCQALKDGLRRKKALLDWKSWIEEMLELSWLRQESSEPTTEQKLNMRSEKVVVLCGVANSRMHLPRVTNSIKED